jgi:phosphatidate phosphatase APP1
LEPHTVGAPSTDGIVGARSGGTDEVKTALARVPVPAWQGGGVAPERVDAVAPPPLHRAAQAEDALHAVLEPRLRRRGWQVEIIAYTGYGGAGWVRVMARALLARRDPRARRGSNQSVRGWRNFLALPVKHAPVVIEAGGRRYDTETDRGGYIDVAIDIDAHADWAPGWRTVRLSGAGAAPVEARVRVVDPKARLGIVSDVDDTVMVTALPRPLLAAWHTFVVDEYARTAVPGMAVLYERLVTAHPDAPVFYLSTGAWNVAPALTRFLSRHLYPAGPLLLTDWGPAQDRWFRSGPAHKRAALTRLAAEFPAVRWLLIGDDGQHDPQLYGDFAASHPEHVAAVAIRRLSPTQSVLAGGRAAQHVQHMQNMQNMQRVPGTPATMWFSGPDGASLWEQLHDAALV